MELTTTTRLLVVHQAAAERLELCGLAEAAGFHADAAGSLTELRSWLETATTSQPCFVLLALQLPDGDAASGIAACQAAPARPPVILLRDDEEAEVLLQAWSAGAAAFLPRQPRSTEALKAVVDAAARRAMPTAPMPGLGRLDPVRIMQACCHDLRNPLSTMMINASILLRDETLSAERRAKIADRILTSANRMSRIIDSVADYAMAGQGKPLPLRTTDADLGAIAADVMNEMRKAHPSRDLVFEQRGDLRGHWDAGRLQRLIRGLLGTVLKRGRPDVTVVVECAEALDAPEVEINISYRERDPGDDKTAPVPRDMSPSWDLEDVNVFVATRIADGHQGSLAVDETDPAGPRFLVRLPKRIADPSVAVSTLAR